MLKYAAFLLASTALLACGSADPTVTISATPASISSGDTVTVAVTVTDFALRSPERMMHQELRPADEHHEGEPGEKVSADGGHYHVYLDSLETNPLRMAWTTSTTVAVSASAGVHRLIVRLNGDDHRFLVPMVMSETEVTVQ